MLFCPQKRTAHRRRGNFLFLVLRHLQDGFSLLFSFSSSFVVLEWPFLLQKQYRISLAEQEKSNKIIVTCESKKKKEAEEMPAGLQFYHVNIGMFWLKEDIRIRNTWGSVNTLKKKKKPVGASSLFTHPFYSFKKENQIRRNGPKSTQSNQETKGSKTHN